MTPPDDLLKRAREWLAPILAEESCGDEEDDNDLVESLEEFVEKEIAAALESDRALLRRIVEAWDRPKGQRVAISTLIDEARARVGEGK